MQKVKIVSVLLACVSLFFSCKKFEEPVSEIKAKENEQAIQAYIQQKGLTTKSLGDGIYMATTTANASGRTPATGELVSLHFVISKLDGSKIDSSSVLDNKPVRFPYGYTEANILQIAAAQLKMGEKATFLIPYFFGFGSEDQGSVPAYSPLRVDVSMVNIQNETEQVASYMADNKYNPTITSTGLAYQILLPVNGGTQVKTGQTIQVKYTGKVLYYTTLATADNKPNYVFDSGTFSFVLGSKATIAGFEEGIAKMKVGEKAILCFPSSLGYGENGSKNNQGVFTILPKAPLAFEVEVISAQ
jgi:FKBP-type peptidyl-prolyl cis-trans isomerase